jgi:beta-glucanase (GH16 family)
VIAAPFFDDFAAFDAAAWQAITQTDPRLQSIRTPANVSVEGGKLVLKVRRDGPRGKPWSTAYVRSTQTFLYGTFEARMRYAPARGLNNAFWLMSDVLPKHGGNEIDINEGWWPAKVRTNIHTPKIPDRSETVSLPAATEGEFHTYGLRWEPYSGGSRLTWTLDGQPIRSAVCPDCDKPVRIIFSTVVFKSQHPDPELDGTSMDADWVRYTPYGS